MKSQKECYEALCSGKTLVNQEGVLAKFCASGRVLQKSCASDTEWVKSIYSFSCPDHWQIYEEPKPKVTYDEAIKNIQKLTIKTPVGDVPSFDVKTQDVLMLLLADLADRKGYRMEVVE